MFGSQQHRCATRENELIIEHNKCKQQLQRLDGSEQRISQVIEAHETM
jgi:hypothetical protein